MSRRVKVFDEKFIKTKKVKGTNTLNARTKEKKMILNIEMSHKESPTLKPAKL